MSGAGATSTNNGGTTSSPSPSSPIAPPTIPTIPEEREVASGIVNLGNTCYANAVLQALAHSPDLCLAMEGEPHSASCPVRLSNAARARERELEREREAGKGEAKGEAGEKPKGEEPAAAATTAVVGNGRGRRGKKQPKASQAESSNGDNGVLDDGEEFCVLCEVEGIVSNVHRAGLAATASAASSAVNADPSSSSAAGPSAGNGDEVLGPVAPNRFVAGFTSEVAPWFRRGRQEDSHEFLRLLIDGMQKSCIRAGELRRAEVGGGRAKKEGEKDGAGGGGGVADADGAENAEGGTGAATGVKAEPAYADGERKSKRPDPQCRAGPDDAPPDAAPPNVDENGAAANGDEETAMTDDGKKNDKDGDADDVERHYPFQLFRGTVESVVTCQSCRATNRTVDPMEDVGLECVSGGGRNGNERTVALALDRFVAPERLDCYKCDACGTVGGATKQSRLASVPPVLTLHLKRFRYGQAGAGGVGAGSGGTVGNGAFAGTGASSSAASSSLGGGGSFSTYGKSGSNKIEGHVRFNELFDVRPYLTDECASSSRGVFCRLFAVVVHTGANSHSGHYYAYVRNLTRGEWWKMDDADVRRASIRQVCDAHAYMLFYTVVKHPVATRLRDAVTEKREEAVRRRMRMEEEAAAAAEAEAARKKAKEEEETAAAAATATATTKLLVPAPIAVSSSASDVPAAVNGDDASARGASETAAGGDGGRKRPRYASGEEWARKRTRLPPSLAVAGTFAVAEAWVSERVEFRGEYFQRLRGEASVARGAANNVSAVVKVEGKGGGSGAIDAVVGGVAEGDVVGGCAKLRKFLRHMLRRMMTSGDPKDCFWLPGDLNEEDDSSSPSSSPAEGGPSPSSASMPATTASTNFVVPVVEANETAV